MRAVFGEATEDFDADEVESFVSGEAGRLGVLFEGLVEALEGMAAGFQGGRGRRAFGWFHKCKTKS